MAEGGFDNENRDLDYQLNHDDDGNDDEETETNTTQPFQPGAASTPYHRDEQTELHTMPQEQSGLDETTPLLGQAQRERAWNTLNDLYPNASSIDAYLDSKSQKLLIKKAGYGEKAYPLYTTERVTSRQRLNPNLSLEIKMALGKNAQEIINEENQSIKEERKRLQEAEKQLKEGERNAVQLQRNKRGSAKSEKLNRANASQD